MSCTTDTPENKPAQSTRCQDCALNLVCLPPSVKAAELPQLDAIIERGQPLPRNRPLFHQGQHFMQLFAVRSGAIKTTMVMDSGIEQITGFYLPGEIIGLESIGNPTYVNSAYALETTSVCAIPYEELSGLGRMIPTLQDHVLGLMSNEIRQGHHVMLAISKLAASERVAMFLLAISARYQKRRLSGDHFHLPMSRGDIGNYLGLTIETISRIFTQLQQQRIIEVQNKDIQILERATLFQMLEHVQKARS